MTIKSSISKKKAQKKFREGRIDDLLDHQNMHSLVSTIDDDPYEIIVRVVDNDPIKIEPIGVLFSNPRGKSGIELRIGKFCECEVLFMCVPMDEGWDVIGCLMSKDLTPKLDGNDIANQVKRKLRRLVKY